jgi:hypothetical protein
MQSSGKAVVGYSAMIFSGPQGNWTYNGKPNQYAIGTSFCFRKDWWEKNQFPAKQVGEDGDFLHKALVARQVDSVDAGELMVASIHPGNTSPRKLSGDPWIKYSGRVPSGFQYAG